MATKKNIDWKTILLIAVGGVAVLSSGMIIYQNHYAALGKQVHRNVLRFLTDNGAKCENGVVSGGIVKSPMRTNAAINTTISTLLESFNSKDEQPRPEAEAEAVTAAAQAPQLEDEKPIDTRAAPFPQE